MSKSIYILHLSDLHIDPANSEQEASIIDHLCRNLEDFRRRKNSNLDLLLVSGDLLCARAESYDPVIRRLDQILTASGLDRNQIFIVPGNHDVTRQHCNNDLYSNMIPRLIGNPNAIDRLNAAEKSVLTLTFESYLSFAENYPLIKPKKNSLPGYPSADLPIHEVNFRICGLNSALTAGADHGKSVAQRKTKVISLQLLSQMLAGAGSLNLVVSHYPLSWIHQDQRERLKNMLQNNNAIYFHGHRHKPVAKMSGIRGMLLSLGAGDVYDGDWQGAKHCQILEFNFNCSQPLLREWFWFPDIGWRFFEPLEIDWNGWRRQREHQNLDFCDGVRDVTDLDSVCRHLGFINIGRSREEDERGRYFINALNCAADNSEFIIVGRSLIDWSLLHERIRDVIRDKKLDFKIALLDENKIRDIEKPVAGDWADENVRDAMRRFKRITVQRDTGSLKIYGLPFYVPRSFIAFTNKKDNKRYCLEEIGMAIPKDKRPFFEIRTSDSEGLGAIIEKMHKSFLTRERLILSDNGEVKWTRTASQGKVNITAKAEKFGLVDLDIGIGNLEWIPTQLARWIKNAPRGSEIFVVGRTCRLFTQYFKELAKAIVDNLIKCTIVIANPEIEGLESPVKHDYAQEHLQNCWVEFKRFTNELNSMAQEKPQVGTFRLYGIPAYVPVTFSAFTSKENISFCTLEPGIAVGATERPCLCFKKVLDSDGDFYSKLIIIYRGIIEGREPLLEFPKEVLNP